MGAAPLLGLLAPLLLPPATALLVSALRPLARLQGLSMQREAPRVPRTPQRLLPPIRSLAALANLHAATPLLTSLSPPSPLPACLRRIADPAAVKPEDWDEDAPRTIPDEEAQKPEGWLDEEAAEVDDPGGCSLLAAAACWLLAGCC